MNEQNRTGLHDVKITGSGGIVRIYIDGEELKGCLSFKLEKNSAGEPTKLFVELPVNSLEVTLN